MATRPSFLRQPAVALTTLALATAGVLPVLTAQPAQAAAAYLTAASVSRYSAEFASGSVSFSGRLTASGAWTVTVTSMCSSTPVRTFSGTDSTLSATWDLKTSTGAWAAPGVYAVSYQAGSTRWARDIEILPRVSGPAAACSTSRVSGPDRYATSVAEGRISFPTGDDVVIVSGAQTSLVDGLVAGPLAFAKQAPILAVTRDGVPAVVADDIARRKPDTAWLVGGPGVVSSTVETRLKQLGVSTIHRLSGTDRYSTAAQVAKEVGAARGEVVVASGTSLVDAVGAAGPAARLGRPIVLVSRDAVPPATAAALSSLATSAATVVGGEGVISETTRKNLGLDRTTRLAGADRYATSVAVANGFASVGSSTVAVASGADANIVDALAGSALGRLTVLVSPASLPSSARSWLAATRPGKVIVLGGPGAVSTVTARAVHQAAANLTNTPTATPPLPPAPAPPPATGPYKLHSTSLGDGRDIVLRWNGCQTITYKVNLADVPTSARPAVLEETHAAFRVIAAKTGFAFVYRGATDEVPRTGSTPGQSAEVVVAYTSPAKTNYPLADATAGYGGFSSNSWWSRTGSVTTYGAAITRGMVVIDTPQVLKSFKPGFGAGATRGNLLLHELGHAFGLQHIDQSSQLMYSSLTSRTPNGFASGDVAGLAKVGKGAGCITVPTSVAPDLG